MNIAHTVPSKAERAGAFRSADWAGRTAIHEAIAAHKAEAMEMRRELGRRYLAQHAAVHHVPFEKAVTVLDLRDETAAARAEAIRLTDGREAQVNNGALEFPVLGKHFAADSPSLKLMTSPLIMAPLVRYFGMIPVLFNMFVTRAHTTEILTNTAHLFHLDPEDIISFKVFVHLTDVDDGCGPFHALPADLTQEVLRRVDYRGIGRIPDEEIERMVGWDQVVKVTGPAGTVALADTTRCLHFGGRPREAGKPVRDMLVAQYLLPTSFLFPIDGDGPMPRFLPALEANGDDMWDALIGAKWT
ncbi:MAG TPA: hypothetical protein VGG10_06400 [Rhizomicrobium sp.]|jgi:hypothetical protein